MRVVLENIVKHLLLINPLDFSIREVFNVSLLHLNNRYLLFRVRINTDFFCLIILEINKT